MAVTVFLSVLSDEERLSCSFEEGLCFWRQEPEDEGDWIRTNTPTFPPFTGPNFDHTFGNQSGVSLCDNTLLYLAETL